ncbi:MAG: hypothetical protein A3K13_12260 [Gemmatimonadetes bacterium RIFCSPLOWO2_12_FULL_68_9]|nr:MAG: hypothetical protein A3K13_12260 [Gemmatimonadetes bacterium RIFCSPLOWO2_12_FULL_68_9]
MTGQGPATWAAAPASVTVGDTVYLTRTLPASPQVRVRPQPLASTAVVEPLADPVVELLGDVLVLRYAVAVFEPGVQRIAMPQVELFYPDGNTETVLGDTALVRVRSVLPPGDSVPPPRTSLAPLPRPRRSGTAAVMLVSLVVAGTGAWVIVRKRVGPRLRPLEAIASAVTAPLRAWVEAGELRAAAAALADQLRRTIAGLEPGAEAGLPTEALLAVLRRRCPGWPLAEIEDVLHALERARFAPAVPHDVLSLAEQVGMLTERLGRAERVAARAGPFEVAPEEGA